MHKNSFYKFSLTACSIVFLVFTFSCKKWDLDKKPFVLTLEVSDTTYTTARLSGQYEVYQDEFVYEVGICLDQEGAPDINDRVVRASALVRNFKVLIDGLSINTRYYYRAWVRTDLGITYGDVRSFKTPAGGLFPVIETLSASEITKSTVTIKANILHEGQNPVLIRGICWSRENNPSLTDDTLQSGAGLGNYQGTIKSLLPNCVYYVTAFAITTDGVFFGNVLSFSTTDGTASVPLVITNIVTSITQTTAVGSGEVVADSGFVVTSRGVCWSKEHLPDLTDFFATEGQGLGTFYTVLAELEPNVTYYLRAFAISTAGTGYGQEVSFTTQTLAGTLPVVVTGSVTVLNLNTATCQGAVNSQGSYPVLYRGFCWATQPSPTISDFRTFEGTGLGTFSSQLENLQESTQYFVRAYASNSAGTAYGAQISFTTGGNTSLTLGQFYQGGIIAYLDSTGQHGLIVTPIDLATGVPWGCDGVLLPGAASTTYGSGMANTVDILSGCADEGIAARLCSDLSFEGFEDWYLPSKDELAILFVNKGFIGNMNTGFYWSSSQYNAYNAWQQNFVTGNQNSYGKFDPAIVRAVRSF